MKAQPLPIQFNALRQRVKRFYQFNRDLEHCKKNELPIQAPPLTSWSGLDSALSAINNNTDNIIKIEQPIKMPDSRQSLVISDVYKGGTPLQRSHRKF